MARFLAIDWDHKQLQIVAATLSKGVVKIQQAAALLEEQSPNPAETEALGQLLKQRLKEAGIAPAPVYVCLGRDRVILKEIRYPVVPEHEEPAVVRFQAIKEITDPAEEVVIDYAPFGSATPGAERRALVVVVRRELLQTYQALCQAAGLKLAGLTPRPFGLMASLQETLAQGGSGEAEGASVGVLALTANWGEFCVARGGQLIFARTVAPAGNLAGEVRRNLSVYNGQAPQNPLRSLYLAGSSVHAELREKLQEALGIPVHLLDPFGGERPDLPAVNRGAFTGAVGLLYLRGQSAQLPINFAQPKQPKPPTDPRRRLYILAGVAAAVFLAVGAYFAHAQLADRDDEIARLTSDKTNLETRLVSLEDDDKRFKSIRAWADAEVDWLDELYDMAARFPDIDNLRLTEFVGKIVTKGPANVKEKQTHEAEIDLKLISADSMIFVNSLVNSMIRDGFFTGVPKPQKNVSVDAAGFPQQFADNAKFTPRSPDKYILRIVPQTPRRRGNRDQNPAEGFFGGGEFQ